MGIFSKFRGENKKSTHYSLKKTLFLAFCDLNSSTFSLEVARLFRLLSNVEGLEALLEAAKKKWYPKGSKKHHHSITHWLVGFGFGGLDF